jgi:serine/threonine protein kinase
MASSPQFENPTVAKFARFHREIGYYVAETQAYSWIEVHNIGSEFLGYLTEDGRVIGFLIEHVRGHHATISDLRACEVTVRRLHALGILHGDLNKHNFLVSERGAILIEFETAKRSENREAMKREVEELEGQLLDESGNGGVVLEENGT